MDNLNYKDICLSLVDTFLFAGDKCLKIRNEGLKTDYKEDNTPVTNGDIEVNRMLTDKILQITPSIPIVSEESPLNKLKNNLKTFWLIDPIDGTYDYVNNKDEFTLNAALIVNRLPIIGLIYAPAKKRMFYTYQKGESFELINNNEKKLDCSKKTKPNQIKAVHYSEKLKPEIKELHLKYGVTEHHKMKSSFKFCVIASSEYDIYISEPRASEWDIAAGHAILQNAGGIVTDFDNNQIIYGKQDFKNSSLILRRSKNL
ncbi:MAG: 3'(2'),5'-bisphosphate nucleotidase CysQ [Rickettsiales bacterium TMED289]|nr:MAG: 3'(2'),5'-bisphosphate nucleotidase CysQ [Rickettsiales bacterium TMED289]|tara:strand:- start:4161 stop:4934 length:774 start_codon:yes stop_codon:yes gene_type:complete